MTLSKEQALWAKRFRWISLIEGISFLVLLGIAMPLKYVLDMPKPVTYVGWAHGVLFVAYILLVIPTARSLKWTFGRTILALIASLLPFGPFIFDRNLKKDQHVDF